MTTPTTEDVTTDKIIEEFKRCDCTKFPDDPCENEWDSLDGLCRECRPRCYWKDTLAFFRVSCCGRAPSCMLVPLLDGSGNIHVMDL